MIDIKKSLQQLEHQWKDCRACELGIRRASLGGSFVFGEGSPRGVMFIGEGPGRTEEEEGRPFVGKSGEILRSILHGYKFTDYYITNIVSCRSCTHLIDDNGNPMFKTFRNGTTKPILRDEVPLPAQMAACSSRLYEEIYLVDPVIIVALGVTSAEFLLKRSVAITKDRGKTEHCTIPGRIHRAVLTEKRKVWERKVKGELIRPTKQNEVRYVVLPTLHPAFVLRKLSDHGADSPWNLLAKDIKKAIRIYEFIKGDISPEEEKEFDYGEEDPVS